MVGDKDLPQRRNDQFSPNVSRWIETNARRYDLQEEDHGEDAHTKTWTYGYPDVHKLMNTLEYLNRSSKYSRRRSEDHQATHISFVHRPPEQGPLVPFVHLTG